MAVSLLESIAFQSKPDAHKHYEQFSGIKKMTYLIEQLMLCDYITMFAGTLVQYDSPADHSYTIAAPVLLREYRNELVRKALAIPKYDFHSGKYAHLYDLMISLVNGNMPHADDLIDVFMDSEIVNDADIYMPKEFMLPFVYAINGTKIDKDRIPNSVDMDSDQYEFFNPIVYTPKYELHKELGFRIVLNSEEAFQVPSFIVEDFTDLRKNMALPYRYIVCLDWKGKSFTHVLGLLEQFSLEHDKHVMQNDSVCTVGDLCYDVVTHSDYCRCCKPSNMQSFIHSLKYLVEKWNIQIDDTVYLGELLKHSDAVDPDIVNYLQKPVESVTVAEMEAFKSSIFASFINKTISATEATDPNKKDDEDEEGFPDGNSKDEQADPGLDPTNEDAPTNPDQPADGGGTDMGSMGDGSDMDMGDMSGGDDASGESGDESENAEETEEHKVARKIPPATDGILLELLNPENETLQDYLYRKEFLYRVNELLQNPSANRYSSQVLFMLKQWATKWLYIFSVPSLKSFLRNINFSIMSNK